MVSPLPFPVSRGPAYRWVLWASFRVAIARFRTRLTEHLHLHVVVVEVALFRDFDQEVVGHDPGINGKISDIAIAKNMKSRRKSTTRGTYFTGRPTVPNPGRLFETRAIFAPRSLRWVNEPSNVLWLKVLTSKRNGKQYKKRKTTKWL